MFFIIEEAKETVLGFSLGTVKILWELSYDIACVAKVSDHKVSDRKVFDRTVCSTILFFSI